MTIQRVSSASGPVKARPVLLLVVAVLAACGGKLDATTFGSSASSSGSASSSASSSGGGSSSASSSSGGEPLDAVKCASLPVGRCAFTFDDAAFAKPDSAYVVTDALCRSNLYVTVTGGSGERTLARYTVRGANGCSLDRDVTFGQTITNLVVAADELGNAYTANPGIARVADGVEYTCKGGDLLPSGAASAIAMERSGLVGYAVLGGTLYRVQPDGVRDCFVAPIAITGGFKLVEPNGIAIDTRGRIHVVDGRGAKLRVLVYDASGGYIKQYTGKPGGAITTTASLTACRGGMCLDEDEAVTALNEEGAFRTPLPYEPSFPLAGFRRIVGDVRGPLLLVGMRGDESFFAVDSLGDP